jgi:hypothetical protein
MFPCIKLPTENEEFYSSKTQSVNCLEKENYVSSFIVYLNIGLIMFLTDHVGGNSRVNHGN